MTSGTAFRARTAPAIIAGILLLMVPPAFFAYEFFLYAATSGTASLQTGQFLTLLKQFGLADVLVYVLVPIVLAIASFRRGKGFIATMAIISAAAWGFELWICIKNAYHLGFSIQMGLWIAAWFFLFIVCLAGMRKAKVGIRFLPWVLGLAAMVACGIQWFIDLGGFGTVTFDGTNIKFVAALTDMGMNFLLAMAALMLSMATGRASAKEAAALAGAKAAKLAAKEQEKAAKAAAKGKGSAATPTPAPVQVVGDGNTTYSFDLAPETIELTAKGDPFAGAMAALDEAGGKISLTLDGADGASSSPSWAVGSATSGNAYTAPAYTAPAATYTAPAAPTATGTSTTARQMSELKTLLDEGILTQAEYEATKARLMK